MNEYPHEPWWTSPDLIFAVGVEDTFIPQAQHGERPLDEYTLTQHYEQWEGDIDLIAESGATMVRWGIPWYRINPARDVWEWEWLDAIAAKFEAVGVTPILDLMHYGTPTWLEGEFFNPEYPDLMSEYARRVAERYRGRWRVYTPLNEPMLNALYCGQFGYWPPYGRGDQDFIRLIRALQRGIVGAQAAIRTTLGNDASFVHVEASFRFVADDPAAEDEAKFLRERAYLIEDLVTGRVDAQHPLHGYLKENGFTDDDFAWSLTNTAPPDVMGVNYYPAGQTEVVSSVERHTGGPGDFRPRVNAWTDGLSDVLRGFFRRYGVPVFLTETSNVGTEEERRAWLNESVAQIYSLRDEGIDVIGYTWWSIIDMMEWTYREGDGPATDYQLRMGLWTLKDDGQGVLRRVRTPLAAHFRSLAKASLNGSSEQPSSGDHDGVVTILAGELNETGPIYTRLLATAPNGPHRGALFLTAEVYRDVGETGPVFPIWKSTDDGLSWVHVSDVTDEHFGFGNRYQPTLYELLDAFSGMPAGTLLLAGSAIPGDMSETHLVLYASVDGAATWKFVSQIDAGGPALYDPGAESTTTAIWEPSLHLAGDELVCTYADERYKDQSMLQTLVHRTTKNLIDWSDRVLDFGVPDRSTRPGMFVCSGELPDGSYCAVFEVVGPPTVPVHFVHSPDGKNWGPPDSIGELLISSSGTTLAGSPNLAWRSTTDGRVEILVTGRLSLESDGTPSNYALLNVNGGNGSWRSVALPVRAVHELEGENSGYSQSLVWAADGSVVQATTVRNAQGSHDIVIGRASPISEKH